MTTAPTTYTIELMNPPVPQTGAPPSACGWCRRVVDRWGPAPARRAGAPVLSRVCKARSSPGARGPTRSQPFQSRMLPMMLLQDLREEIGGSRTIYRGDSERSEGAAADRRGVAGPVGGALARCGLGGPKRKPLPPHHPTHYQSIGPDLDPPPIHQADGKCLFSPRAWRICLLPSSENNHSE